MFDGSIKAYFGGDTAGITKAVNEVEATVSHLNERMGRRFEHKIFSGIIGTEALRTVKEFAHEAIAEAQRTREEFERLGKPIDEDTARLARFGDGLKELHAGAVGLVGGLVAKLNGVGEAFGSWINRLRGISAEQEKVAEEAERGAARQLEAAAKLHKENSPEKLAAAEKELARVRAESAVAGMSALEKLTALRTRQLEIEQKIAHTGPETVAHIEAETEATRNLAAIEQARARVREEENRRIEQDAERSNRLNDRWYELENRRRDIRLAELPAEERLIALQKEAAELQRGITLAGEKSANGIDFANKLLDVQAKIRSANLEITEAQAKAEEKSAAAVAKTNAQTTIGFGIRHGREITEASDAALQDLVRRDRNKILAVQQRAIMRPLGRSIADDIEVGQLSGEAMNAERELRYRQGFRGNLSRLGVEGARRQFTGDPLAFDRLVEQMTKGADKTDRMISELEKVNGHLGGLLKNQ